MCWNGSNKINLIGWKKTPPRQPQKMSGQQNVTNQKKGEIAEKKLTSSHVQRRKNRTRKRGFQENPQRVLK